MGSEDGKEKVLEYFLLYYLSKKVDTSYDNSFNHFFFSHGVISFEGYLCDIIMNIHFEFESRKGSEVLSKIGMYHVCIIKSRNVFYSFV